MQRILDKVCSKVQQSCAILIVFRWSLFATLNGFVFWSELEDVGVPEVLFKLLTRFMKYIIRQWKLVVRDYTICIMSDCFDRNCPFLLVNGSARICLKSEKEDCF